MCSVALSLYELNSLIREALQSSFPETCLVVAEISELRVNRNGHCYMELVEKDGETDDIIAKARATMWAFSYRIINPYFESVTGRELAAGLKILISVTVQYHEVYGLSLNVKDIDPSYTLGDMARKKQEIIARLEKEGVIDMNRELPFPLVPQKIAVISSSTAAGYGDFMNELENNPYTYRFYCKLFPAYMQGTGAVDSIIHALEEIYRYNDFFDAVAIIRGGGSRAELNCFDDYDLAFHITQFPLPIITGIGHERDDSIADRVSHIKMKTPTAVAAFLVEKVHEFEQQIMELSDRIFHHINLSLESRKKSLHQTMSDFLPMTMQSLQKKDNDLKILLLRTDHLSRQFFPQKKQSLVNLRQQLFQSALRFIQNRKHTTDLMQKTIDLVNPDHILRRGYSITMKQGKIVRCFSELNPDDVIQTKFSDGMAESRVIRSEVQEK